MVVHRLVAVVLDEFITLGGLKVFAQHLGGEFFEGGLGPPTEFGLAFGRVAQQGLDFGWAEVAGIHGNDELVSLGGFPVAFLVYTIAFPADGHAQLLGGGVDEVAHAVLHAGGYDEVFGLGLLQH